MEPLDECIRTQLNEHAESIENKLNSDLLAIISPILPGVEFRVRKALDLIETSARRKILAVILDTDGGIVEVVERMVNTIRHYYSEVIFVIPNRAMSAGTVFAMSGDRILMDFFSCLGPIDPQIEKDGKLIPALSYLNEFERLNSKAAQGQLTSAEYALLSKLDLGELDQFRQAKELSKDLLIKWLSQYKFKNWTKTETRNTPVSQKMKEKRAAEIAEKLGDIKYWHSHGRAINLKALTEYVGLKIEDMSTRDDLAAVVREYFGLLRDYMFRGKIYSFVHTKSFF